LKQFQQAGQLGKIEKEISANIEETKETVTDPAKYFCFRVSKE